MHLSINSYNQLTDQMYKAQSAKLENKQLSVVGDFNSYIAHQPKTIFEKQHFRNLMGASLDKRVYKEVLGIMCDVSLDLEVIGVTKYAKENTIMFTLQDSLDLVLNYLCDVDMRLLRALPNYKQISRGILNADHEMLKDVKFGDLIGLDSRLDIYLISLNTAAVSYDDFLNKFLTEITCACNVLLHQFVMQYRMYYSDRGYKLPLRSKNICSVVISSDIEIDDSMELVEGYFIKVKSYKKGEYIHHVNDDVSYLSTQH